MQPTQLNTKKSFAGTGVFAMLRGLLDVKGTSTPKITKGIGASIALLLALACLAPGVASAAFTRPFERQIFRSETVGGHLFTEPCTEVEAKAVGSPCLQPAGVAADSANNLWVGDRGVLDEFEPAPAGNKPIPLSPEFKVGAVDSVAIESATAGNGDVYVAENRGGGQGAVEVVNPTTEKQVGKLESGVFLEPQVAVDNNPEADIADPSHCSGLPAECTVYVLSSVSGGSDLGGVEKFNSKLAPEPFSDSGLPYVSGNRITGTPSDPTGGFNEQEGGVATDAAGDIYVASARYAAVYEFKPTGEYEREIHFENPEVLVCGVVGRPKGVAVDPVSGNLLVSLVAGACGAVDEFGTEEPEAGKFVAQITETSAGAKLENLYGVSVDSLGDVYLVERTHPSNGVEVGQNVVDVWGPGVYDPTVTLGQANPRTGTTAELHGLVNPAQHGNTEQTSHLEACYFQYIEEAAFTKEQANHEEEGFATAEKESCAGPAIPSEPEAQYPVHATITKGLLAGHTYRYRLVATSGGKLGGTVRTAAVAFTAPAKPLIVSTSAENLSSTFADLHAQIAPLGADTSYRFEYDTRPYVEGEGAHGASIPVPDEGIGAGGPTGGAVENVLQHIGGLAPGTTYYFRVVAVNEIGPSEETANSSGAFTTLPAAVSDERGYELVTPADKQGGSDMFAHPETNSNITNFSDVGIPADNGEGFLLRTESGFGAFPFAFTDQYVFKREAQKDGWSYTSLASPSLGTQQGSAELSPASADLERVTLDDAVGSLAGEEGVTVMSLAGPPGGPYIKVHQDLPKYNAQEFEAGTAATKVVGASSTLGTMILETHEPSSCDPEEKIKHGGTLCEFSETQPALELVNTAPGEEGAPTSPCGARIGAGNSSGLAHGAVSSDGSRVFFMAPDPQARNKGAGCWNGDPNSKGEGSPVNAPQLYARVATGEGAHEVLKISEPEPGVTEPGHSTPVRYPAVYVGASADGSRVFFETETWMTANHPEEGHDTELYEWETEGSTSAAGACGESSPNYVALSRGCLTRVSAGMEGEKEGAHVAFVVAVASQGTSVYFTAFNVLAAHATHHPPVNYESGEAGPVSLYRYDVATGHTTYVTAVDALDNSGGAECSTHVNGDEDTATPCNQSNWYVTPDGRYLLFGDSLEVEGYNRVAAGCVETRPRAQGAKGGRCMELYRFDAVAEEHGEPAIACVSCGSGLADSAGNAQFARSSSEDGSSGQVRGMSDNGEYVFFDSQAALVSGASNHTLDTYQWREDLATHERSISLVGSGTDPAPTFFLGYSPYEYETPAGKSVCARNPERLPEPGHQCEVVEAGNVFIGTHAKLSPVQTNSVGNIYDARACEEDSPCIKPPLGETAQCLGGECQKSPLAPSDPVATLLAPPAPVSLAPAPPAVTKKSTPKCKKGEVKKKVKKKEECVKKPKKKSKAKKSNHGRGK